MKSSGIGGQAVMEGVMMRNKNHYAVAVRKPDGEIAIEKGECSSIKDKYKILGIPIVRGVVNFIESLVLGMSMLTSSASYFEESDQQTGKFEAWLQKKMGKKADKLIMGFTVFLSILLAVAIFMLLPLGIVSFIPEEKMNYQGKTLLEGGIRILIFILYILLISRMKDIRRVFMYHGAEHKTINCIEKGLAPTVSNVRRCSKQHKRCGTSFLLFVMIISVIFFLIFRVETVWLRFLVRILFVPVIAGVSYEFIRFAGNSDSKIVGVLAKPGLWLQGLTTREPDDKMIKVAVASVEAVFDWQAFLSENFGNKDKRKVHHANRSQGQDKEKNQSAKDRKQNQNRSTVVPNAAKPAVENKPIDKPIVENKPVEKPVKSSAENGDLLSKFDFSFPKNSQENKETVTRKETAIKEESSVKSGKEKKGKGKDTENVLTEEEVLAERNKLKAKVLISDQSRQERQNAQKNAELSSELAAAMEHDVEEDDPILKALDKFFLYDGDKTVMEQSEDGKK